MLSAGFAVLEEDGLRLKLHGGRVLSSWVHGDWGSWVPGVIGVGA